MELKIEDLRLLCTNDTIVVTQHASYRLKQRNINFEDVKHTIMTGEIIEQYPNDYPEPSCLVLGLTVRGKYLHTVAGICDGFLWIITAYYPDTDKWNKDFKTRKV